MKLAENKLIKEPIRFSEEDKRLVFQSKLKWNSKNWVRFCTLTFVNIAHSNKL